MNQIVFGHIIASGLNNSIQNTVGWPYNVVHYDITLLWLSKSDFTFVKHTPYSV